MVRRFIEEGRLQDKVLSKNDTFRIIDSPKFVISLLVSSFILAASMSSEVEALGVGAAEADSFIGEQLSVRIPLFNVTDPNSLSISFESEQFDGNGQAKVNAVLDRSNSQLSIKLSSDSVVNEPYVSFKLDLVDSNDEFSKEFTVLMDLPARRNTDVVSPFETAFAASEIASNGPAQAGSLMGPYDTAQPGSIPERFGAVLDGQSLWRVARRINEAMGVSKSQMIWSLYQANPDAFSSRSVSSLKAGSFLTIPDETVVRAVSDSQAKANLSALRSNLPKTSQVAVSNPNDELEAFDLTDSDPVSGQQQAAPFQVTGIDSAGDAAAAPTDLQSQQVIVSLTETVGNLSQQLFRKDQKIEFLEKQVVELKSFINDDTLTEFSDSSAIDTQSSEFEVTSETALAQESASIAQDSSTAVQEPEAVAEESVTVVEQSSASEAGSQGLAVSSESASIDRPASVSESTPIWQWLLLCFFSLSLLAYFMRDRLYALFQSLNLFGSNDEVEFNSVAIEEAPRQRSDAHAEPSLDIPDASKKAEKDYSILSAVENSMSDKDVLDGISYLDLADDGSYEENDVLEFETEETVEDSEDLSFDERFERLLAERDFEFARELLDFARHNEINDERYHCERLRMLEKMRDEDGFYEYYYEIESKIPTFPQNLQTQISQLVVQLAQH